eukprot:scaffold111037_cov17-Tisochrysis_lutea.AAC.1
MLDMLKSEMAVHELLSGNFKRQEQIPSSALMDWALIRFPVNFFLAYARRASTFPSISILDFFCRLLSSVPDIARDASQTCSNIVLCLPRHASSVRQTYPHPCMADLLAHRQQDEGMSLGGRLMSAVNQWVPLIQKTAANRQNVMSEAREHQQQHQQQRQQEEIKR